MKSIIFRFALVVAWQVVSANVVVVPRTTKSFGPDAWDRSYAGLRWMISHNCKVDFLDSIEGWSREKLEYCCHKNKMLCAVPALGQAERVVNEGYDCDAGLAQWERVWLVGKKVWCCANKGKGCPTDPGFDCDVNFIDWRVSWATGKRVFCCKRVFCSWEASEAILAKSNEANYFDCQAAAKNWEIEWSNAKNAWCRRSRLV